MQKIRSGKTSFTLIELIMVIVIMAIIASAGIPLLVSTAESWIIASRRNELSESAKVTLDRIIREIRQVNNNTSVIAANGTNFQFIEIGGGNISFSLSGTAIRRTENGTTNNLTGNVNSFNFTYYHANGTAIAAPATSPLETDIKRIDLNLTLSLGGSQLPFESSVWPRRLQ